jgi:intracellular multiplication protein IcmC
MKIKNFIYALSFMALMNSAYAAPGIGEMFANFQGSAEAIIRLIKAAAYIMGLYLIVGSIFKFTQLSGQGQTTLKMPLIMFLSGVGIFALTGSLSVASQTLAMGNGPGSLLMPSGAGMNAATSAAILGVLTFIRMVGYLAFIRGWLLLNQHGQGKEGTLGRGLTHIGGGVAAINVTITAKILANTFAPGLPMPF